MASPTDTDELDEELVALLRDSGAAETSAPELLAWAHARVESILAGDATALEGEVSVLDASARQQPPALSPPLMPGTERAAEGVRSDAPSHVAASPAAPDEAHADASNEVAPFPVNPQHQDQDEVSSDIDDDDDDDEILELEELEEFEELDDDDDNLAGAPSTAAAESNHQIASDDAHASARRAAGEASEDAEDASPSDLATEDSALHQEEPHGVPGAPALLSGEDETRAYAVHNLPLELVPTVGPSVLREHEEEAPQHRGSGPFRSAPPSETAEPGAPDGVIPADATGPLAVLVLRDDAPRLSRIPQTIEGDTIGLGRRSSRDFDGGSYLWRCQKWQDFSVLYERELINGALFARSNDTPDLHAHIEIFLELPDQVPRLRVTGTVIQVNPIEEALRDGGRAGFAVQLLGLTPHRRALLADIAKTAQAVASLGREVTSARDELAEIATASESEVTGTVNIAEIQIEEELRAELRRLTPLSPMDRLELEGPERDVHPSHAANAFTRLASYWHPDMSERFQGSEARRLAMQVFLMLEEAYQHLTSARSSTTIPRVDDQPVTVHRPPSGPREVASHVQSSAPPTATTPGTRRSPPPPPSRRGTTRSSFEQADVETRTDWEKERNANLGTGRTPSESDARPPARRDEGAASQQRDTARANVSRPQRPAAPDARTARLAASLRPPSSASTASNHATVARLAQQRAASRDRAAARDAATKTEPDELGRAVELMSLRRYDDAIALLHRVSAPQNTEKKYRVLLLLAQGRSAAAKRQVDQALDIYQQLLSLDPDHPVAKRDWLMLQALNNSPTR